MSSTKFSTSSILRGFPKNRSLLTGNIPPNSYESIATVSSTSNPITFSSIPNTYAHLEIRYVSSSNSYGNLMNIQYNGISTTSYAFGSFNFWVGTTPTIYAQVSSPVTYISLTPGTGDTASTGPVFGTILILDYASTSKNKTMISHAGLIPNSSTQAISGLNFGTFLSTAAISSITMTQAAGALSGYQSIALYGIKG